MDIRLAVSIAHQLMRQHGLDALGWRFELDRAKKRFGVCHYGRRVIGLSEPLAQVNNEAEVRDTILHEIAHALTPGEHHGIKWQLKAQSIGARPERCGRGNGVATRYRGVCADCGKTVANRCRKPKRLDAYSHTPCRWKADKGRITWYDGKTRLGVAKPYIPTPTPVTTVATPPDITQSQINELWERMNKLEGRTK